jgi:hypothetical protein
MVREPVEELDELELVVQVVLEPQHHLAVVGRAFQGFVSFPKPFVNLVK